MAALTQTVECLFRVNVQYNLDQLLAVRAVEADMLVDVGGHVGDHADIAIAYTRFWRLLLWRLIVLRLALQLLTLLLALLLLLLSLLGA